MLFLLAFSGILIASGVEPVTVPSPSDPTAGEPLRRAAVLPVACMGVSDRACQQIRIQLAEAVMRTTRAESVSLDSIHGVAEAICSAPVRWWDCVAYDEPLLAFGRALDAPLVISARLATLGGSSVLKIRAADLRANIIVVEDVDVTSGHDAATFSKLALLAPWTRSVDPAVDPPPRSPWYAEWSTWAWVVAGVVVATTTVWLVTQSNNPDPTWDHRHTLPMVR